MATIAVLHAPSQTSIAAACPPPAEAPRFRVTVGGAPLPLAPGAVSAALSAWLHETGARDFTVLTAANPHSFALSPEANRQRHRSLVRALVFEGVRFVEAVAADFDGEQPAVVAFDLGAERAAALGLTNAQGRVLFGDRRQARFIACCGLEFQI